MSKNRPYNGHQIAATPHQQLPQTWNERTSIRSTPETLEALPSSVTPESQTIAKEIRGLLAHALQTLKTLGMKNDFENDDADEIQKTALLESAPGLIMAVERLKALPSDDLDAMNKTLALSAESEPIFNSLLGTIMGDVLTGLSKIYDTMKKEHRDKRHLQTVETAITDAVGLMKKINPDSLRVRRIGEAFVVEELQENLARTDELYVPEARTVANRRSTLRAVDIPKTVWMSARLEQVLVEGHEKRLNIREVWNSIIQKTEEYVNLAEAIEDAGPGKAPEQKISRRRMLVLSLHHDIRLMMETLEHLDDMVLKRMERIGMLSLLTGDMITLLGVIENVLAREKKEQLAKNEMPEQKKEEVLNRMREKIALEQVTLRKLWKVGQKAEKESVPQSEVAIRNATRSMLLRTLNEEEVA